MPVFPGRQPLPARRASGHGTGCGRQFLQPDAAGKQKSVIVNNLKINKGDKLVAKDANGKEIIAIASPRTFSESSICISATGIATVEKAE